MKKIITIIVTILCIYFIYSSLYKNQINYVSISDNIVSHTSNNYNDYLKEYLVENNKLGEYNISFVNDTISKIYEDILNNRTIRINNNDYYFKKVLRESDFVVINVGMEELTSNFDNSDSSDLFNKMYLDINILVQEIIKYAKGTIVFLGYYNPTNNYDANVDEFFYNMNDKLNKLMMKYNINYVDLYSIVKLNYHNNQFINNDIHKKIATILEFYMK